MYCQSQTHFSLVLQSDRKDFGAVRRAVSSTLSILREMSANSNSIHLKSFNAYDEVVSQVESFVKGNVASKNTRKRLKMDHSTSLADFHESVAKPFLIALSGNILL